MTTPEQPGVEVIRTWRWWWADVTREVGSRPQARWLCEEASGAFGPEFDDELDTEPTRRMIAHLDAMLARLRTGEPVQYVLGHWSFRRLDLMVDRRVLIPRPETELVAEVAIDAARAALRSSAGPVRCADLGTGSGAIGLSLAFELPRGRAEVWLTDASDDALDVARANGAGLGVSGGMVRYGRGRWFDALPAELRGTFDVIVSNPPYIAEGDPGVEPSVLEWEPSSALFAGRDGLYDLRVLAAGAAEWLGPGGRLVLEIGAAQGTAVAELLTAAGLVDVGIHRDLAGLDRIAVATRP